MDYRITYRHATVVLFATDDEAARRSAHAYRRDYPAVGRILTVAPARS